MTCICIDVLHTVDLGVTAHVLGNIFYLVASQRRGSLENEFEWIDAELDKYTKKRKRRPMLRGKLTLKRCKTGSGYPKLKAKGSNCRELIDFGFFLARQANLDERVIALAQLLQEFYKIIYSQPLHMDQASIDRMEEIGEDFSKIYAGLSNEAFRQRRKQWKISPKHHLFLHLCIHCVRATGLNPRSYWCYCDEDLVGQLITIGESCHPRTLAPVALAKWVAAALGGP